MRRALRLGRELRVGLERLRKLRPLRADDFEQRDPLREHVARRAELVDDSASTRR